MPATYRDIAAVMGKVDAEITIKGTNYQLEQVYGRVQCECPLNGKKQPVNVRYYAGEDDFNKGFSSLTLNLETDFGAFDVPNGKYQGIQLAHELFAEKMRSLGYEVEVIL